MSKECSKCFTRKPLREFYEHSKGQHGRMAACKECHKVAVKKRRRENPAVQAYERKRAKAPTRRAKARQLVISWRKRFPERYAAMTAINNAIRDKKLDRVSVCGCGSAKNVFAIAADPARPIESVIWRCALCHHRGRFAAIEEGVFA